jgi:CxxC motif-containing protein (DUF1111 family)
MRSQRFFPAAAAVLLAAGCERPLKPGDPLKGLSAAEREQFDKGRAVFERVFTPETGLGPLFNADACGECHEAPVAGGVGDEVEVHATAFLPDGLCDPLADAGGPVYQQQVTPALKSALGIDREPIPDRATARANRTTPDLLGFGLLDAVPESTVLSYADPEDRNKDGISGRPNRFFDGRLGRFGRKALVPTLAEFNEGALPLEQGITNPSVPDEETVAGQPIPPGVDPVPEPEIGAADVALINAFVGFLAPPAFPKLSGESKRGAGVFARIGCGDCHVPVLKTGPHSVPALANREVRAYTDLLLHDMGPELADICLGLATPSEFRTEPLMGLRFSESFLHDGRAKSIGEAIRLHGGEASGARDRFGGLSTPDREALLAFLKQL